MKKIDRQVLLFSEMAFRNITILLVFVFGGLQADKYFETKPLWIIICSLLATGYVVCSLVMLGSKKNEL